MAKNVEEVLTDCTLCYHSCGTRVMVEGGKAVKILGLESHPLNKGRLCPKGEAACHCDLCGGSPRCIRVCTPQALHL